MNYPQDVYDILYGDGSDDDNIVPSTKLYSTDCIETEIELQQLVQSLKLKLKLQ